jgi:hypothetical protein
MFVSREDHKDVHVYGFRITSPTALPPPFIGLARCRDMAGSKRIILKHRVGRPSNPDDGPNVAEGNFPAMFIQECAQASGSSMRCRRLRLHVLDYRSAIESK